MTSSGTTETAHGNKLAPDIYLSGASIPNVRHWAGEGALRAPFEPPVAPGPVVPADGRRRGPSPPWLGRCAA